MKKRAFKKHLTDLRKDLADLQHAYVDCEMPLKEALYCLFGIAADALLTVDSAEECEAVMDILVTMTAETIELKNFANYVGSDIAASIAKQIKPENN